MNMDFIKLIISALPGIAAIITLVYQLVKYIRQTVKEKRWPELMNVVMSYMERAETMFVNGADKKEWVMAMIKATADTAKYEIDMDAISEMIDSMCNMSKVINSPAEKAGE